MESSKTVQIRSLDNTGDSVLAEFDPKQKESVEVAQDKLTEFLASCVGKFGNEKPPVWAKRAGDEEYTQIEPTAKNIAEVEEILVHRPVVGG